MRVLARFNRIMASCVIVFAIGSAGSAHGQLFGISQGQEMDAGKSADVQICKQYKVSHDKYYNDLVTHLGSRLARVSERTSLPWTFRVLDSDVLNAFSVPGFVYVTTNTIEACGKDQDELAGVIGHEIGHTCGKHAAKQMQKSALGGVLVGLLGNKNKNAATLASVAGNFVMLGYSRDDENDADRRAVHYTYDAGYDSKGLIRFFEYLEKHGDKSTTGIGKYLQDHPATVERVKRVQREIDKVERSQDVQRDPPQLLL